MNSLERHLQQATQTLPGLGRFNESRSAFSGKPRFPRPLAGCPLAFGEYLLQRLIGYGGTATVYKARHRNGDRTVALKILRPDADDPTRRRFQYEAYCASVLHDPNIVEVYGITLQQGQDYIVMEYVPGKTLAQVIPEKGLPLRTCLSFAGQIARGLVAVHAEGLVHRDLKPTNLKVTPDGIVKILDFGLAKFTGRRRRERPDLEPPVIPGGTTIGTIGYMSPEQVRRLTADPRSDVFSSGVILYEMLTGRRPFYEDSTYNTLHAIVHETPPKLPARIPVRIRNIARRCLEKDASRRYQTAHELLVYLTLAAETLD
jgi:serine/threonine protein kinase